MRLVSISEISTLTGMAPRTIKRRLTRLEPTPGRKGAHLYASDQALSALYRLDGGDGERLDPAQEQAGLARARRRLAELQHAREARELIPAAIVIEHQSGMAAAARAKLLGLPAKLSWNLATESDPLAIQSALQSAIHEALAELGAEGLPEASRRRIEEIAAELAERPEA